MTKDLFLTIKEGKEFVDILPKIKCKLCILVFGCVTIDKYRSQIDGILSTWAIKCDSLDIPYFIFVGQNLEEYETNQHFISLKYKGVEDDYNSAAYKQYLGIQWIMSRYDTEFLYIIGSDTYVNVDNLYKTVNKYNCEENLFIGNGKYMALILEHKFQIHTGGSGFILTKKSLEILKPYFYKFQERWTDIINACYPPNSCGWIPACDVSISLLCYLLKIRLVLEFTLYDIKSEAKRDDFISIHGVEKEEMIELDNSIVKSLQTT